MATETVVPPPGAGTPPSPTPQPYRTWPVQLAVLGVVLPLAFFSRLPSASEAEVQTLATSFRFAQTALPGAPVPEGTVHLVNQSADNLRFYLYALGASVALGDLDGDGLPNDVCWTDIRGKAVMVGPVPGTPARYEPFALEFGDEVNLRASFPSLVRIGDFNEDGRSDLFVGFAGRTPLLYLRRDGGETGPAPLSNALYARRALVAQDEPWYTTTATTADLDGDGHLDLVVGNYLADGARVYDPDSAEPFEMNDSFAHAENGGTDRMFLWESASAGAEPQAGFRDAGDVFPERGEYRWTLAVGAADLNRDGLSELYISNDFGPDQLLLNRSRPGELRFEELQGPSGLLEPTSMVLGRDSFKSMGIDFRDINHDGLFDMFVSNISSDFALRETHFLWVSQGGPEAIRAGHAPYRDLGEDLGVGHSAWGWESIFEDFDNDGTAELVQATGFIKGEVNRWAHLGQLGIINDELVKHPSSWPKIHRGADVDGWDPNPFYVRGAERYVDVSGVVFPGLLPNSRGIATADVDGDGDQDMAYANHWEDSLYFENQAPAPGAFLGLHLLLPVGDAAPAAPAGPLVHAGHPGWREGTPAVGAFVRITPSGQHAQIRQLDGGNGHTGQRARAVHFGLGELAPDAEVPVAITWRDRAGALHEHALTLTPGWHTVVLAAAPGGE